MQQQERAKYPLFTIGVVTASALFGAAGGILPYLWGAIPGAAFGLGVGLLWMRVMLHRLDPIERVPGRGFLWGLMMGLVATTALHATQFVISIHLYGGDDQAVFNAIMLGEIAAVIGIPTGIVSGGVLGLICGVMLRTRVVEDSAGEVSSVKPSAVVEPTTNTP
jgi:hypothetical protein